MEREGGRKRGKEEGRRKAGKERKEKVGMCLVWTFNYHKREFLKQPLK